MPKRIERIVEHQNRPYLFVPYDDAWPPKLQEVATVLKEVFGDEALLIEHVGSTAVPGMWAKPQIDILVTVKHFQNMPEFYEPMARYGYKAYGDYTSEGEEYFAHDNAVGVREISVHVLPDRHRWASELLDIRDYLRAHPDEVASYSRVKREANKEYPADYTNYFKAKLEAVLQIKQRAIAWRNQ